MTIQNQRRLHRVARCMTTDRERHLQHECSCTRTDRRASYGGGR